jgi:hypothetical protein
VRINTRTTQPERDFPFSGLCATTFHSGSRRCRIVHLEIEMSLKRSSQATIQKPVIAMPCRPLGLAEARFVEDALSEVAPDWSVDLEGVCEHEASLVLLPEGGDDAMGPSFVIRREDFGFRLDQLHWDKMQEVGTYPALADVVTAVQERLGLGYGFGIPASSTCH